MVSEKAVGLLTRFWVTRQVLEKAVEYKFPIHLCFVDLSKAYDSVNRTAMTMCSYVEVLDDFHQLLRYSHTISRQVMTEDDESQVF